MNTKDKYNSIIQRIEAEVSKPYTNATVLSKSVARDTGFSLKDLNTIMLFMTGKTLRDYIKYRQMMTAYQYLLSCNELDIEGAISLSGFDNQSSFTKKFTKLFGAPPRETFLHHDASMYEEAMTWVIISSETQSIVNVAEESALMKNQNVFGITQEQYDNVIKASELQDLYGLDQIYSQIAFEVAENYKLPLESAFEYMESWMIFLQEDYQIIEDTYILSRSYPTGKLETSVIQNTLREKCAFDKDVLFLYFNCELSVTLSIITLDRVGISRDILFNMNCLYIYEYAHTTNFDVRIFKRACNYFEANTDETYDEDNFHDFIDLISSGTPIENALDSIIPNNDDDEFYDYYETEEDYKREAEDYEYNIWEQYDREMQEWNNNARIDYENYLSDPYLY